ncbi:hypothetical protein PUNSTDRAFT_93745 [Punctularia strigosozonata HHB-11173 SS5]|uniref:G-patch domain-containing protein n=1 Tax=Punctularia strigosozonata (strain HHB-11173) TaxID=741275 RepID=R7S1V3_PUNST|nr:uncharacterized protein PUNSTDRAFT_93745 [Punctularia strigosozonata HHB-11173 SS5]EIN03742.1 hypothetical protein PUNSTDRAFT_93745 [Punctularia strigosozonata HHB-11173 SS5]
MRLVALRSRILAKGQGIAVIDAYDECQIGRDAAPAGVTKPRIRLKEMEVSKLHATVYWDTYRKEWAVVDMGSMHGTFVLSNIPGQASTSDAALASPTGARLSPSRVASVPRRLSHLDLITIGSTTFCLHFHGRDPPCEECSLHAGGEIPLFPKPKKVKPTVEVEPSPTVTSGETVDPRKALASLKRNMLSRHAQPTSADRGTGKRYVDRSARRRALYPHSPADAPGTSSPKPAIVSSPVPTRPPTPPAPDPVSAPATPLPSTNIGHKLLMKQGWAPGTALGLPGEDAASTHRVEPIEVNANVRRAGIGIQAAQQIAAPSPTFGDWKEDGKRKRWENFQRPGFGS